MAHHYNTARDESSDPVIKEPDPIDSTKVAEKKNQQSTEATTPKEETHVESIKT
jgi:hypothetical protein